MGIIKQIQEKATLLPPEKLIEVRYIKLILLLTSRLYREDK
jgi:hypothetical protein